MSGFCAYCNTALVPLDPSRKDSPLACPKCPQDGRPITKPRAFVAFVDGCRNGESVFIGERAFLGRSSDCEIQIPEANVSRRHAEISLEGGRFWIKDLGSRNGIQVGNTRVPFAPLEHGSLIRIGQSVLRFETALSTEHAAGGTDRVLVPQEPAPKPISLDSPASAVRMSMPADKAVYPVAGGEPEHYRKAVACLQAVYRVSEALVGIFDPNRLLDRLLELVLETVPADRAYALLKDDSTGDFALRAARFREDRHAENQRPMSQTVLHKVVSERVSLLVADASTDERFGTQRSIATQGIRSIMCVPLGIGSSIFGVVTADTLRSKNAFDDEDLKMLTAIAQQASVALEQVRLSRKLEEDTRTRGLLERYLPPELVEQAVSRKLQLNPGGELKALTILFSDIRGFTGMSERMEPGEIVELVNEYFGMMVEVLFRHGGTLDKFIGDSIMAFWGAPLARPDDPLRAVRCAVEMQEKLSQFNSLMANSNQLPIPVGIGINTGRAVVGNLGSARRYEYTVLGDAVNIASRVQQFAEPGQILITGSTFDAVRSDVKVEEMPPAELRGRQAKVPLYRVLWRTEV